MKGAAFRGARGGPAADSSSEAVWRNVDDFGDSGFWVMTRVPPAIGAGSCPGDDGAYVDTSSPKYAPLMRGSSRSAEQAPVSASSPVTST